MNSRNSFKIQNNRFDCILIWGHGMKYLYNILDDIQDNKNFNILKIQKHKIQKMKKFVKDIYRYDCAPFSHLEPKITYLLKTPNEVCFVFIENLQPNEDYVGEGGGRHKESMTLNEFKEELRNKYNSYDNGNRTCNHVVHTTDSQEHTHYILKYLGYNEGVKLFNKTTTAVSMPYYLKNYNIFDFIVIKCNDIFCKVLEGNSWDDFSVKVVGVRESPQYLGLTKDISIYQKYLDKFLGGPLQEYYNVERYTKLRENFEHLKASYKTSFVIVEKKNGKYIILDGLHRACIHVSQGNSEIKVCKISK